MGFVSEPSLTFVASACADTRLETVKGPGPALIQVVAELPFHVCTRAYWLKHSPSPLAQAQQLLHTLGCCWCKHKKPSLCLQEPPFAPGSAWLDKAWNDIFNFDAYHPPLQDFAGTAIPLLLTHLLDNPHCRSCYVEVCNAMTTLLS